MGNYNSEVIMVIKLIVIALFLVCVVGIGAYLMKLLFDREE